MAISVSQLLSASYPAVIGSKPTNQWSESAFLHNAEKQGMIKRVPGGTQIEHILDYQENPDADFLATDFTAVGMDKTEVLTSAIYTIATLSIPVKWSKGDEAKNSETNQKVALVKSLLENADTTHDEVIERTLFAAAVTDGFNPIPVLLPILGQGNIGGIDSAVETWWRNPVGTYNANFSDIEAIMTAADNSASKGSGSSSAPTLLVGSSDAHAGFEGTLQALQRYVNTDEAKAGFKTLQFRGKPFVFSQYAPTTFDQVFGLSSKAFELVVFKNAYKMKGDVLEIPNVNGYVMKIFSALQATLKAKSRCFTIAHA
jgi:hypothetical protein